MPKRQASKPRRYDITVPPTIILRFLRLAYSIGLRPFLARLVDDDVDFVNLHGIKRIWPDAQGTASTGKNGRTNIMSQRQRPILSWAYCPSLLLMDKGGVAEVADKVNTRQVGRLIPAIFRGDGLATVTGRLADSLHHASEQSVCGCLTALSSQATTSRCSRG
jgi:hypothetical protein